MTVAVVDAGPIIHLGQLEKLHLLADFELVIPGVVLEELRAGDSIPTDDVLDYESVEVEALIEESALDRGERAALTLATRRGAMVLTDDLRAREIAKEKDVEVHGSVGLIVRGFAMGTIDREEAIRLLWSLQEETSLFVTDGVIERGIALLDDRAE